MRGQQRSSHRQLYGPFVGGWYVCLSKEFETDFDSFAKFLAPPKWVLEPVDRNGVVGSPVQMHCQANGKPEPRVLWKRLISTSEQMDQLASSAKSHLVANEVDSVPSGNGGISASTGNYKTLISGSRVQTLVNGTLYFLEASKEDTGTLFNVNFMHRMCFGCF